MIEYLMLFIGTPYIWGGNTPMEGFDCSGLLCEGLKSEGVIRYYEDLTAQGIYDRLSPDYVEFEPSCNRIRRGDILFFGPSKKMISHIGIAVNERQMLEAGGGDSTTKTKKDAIRRGAMVRIRLIESRSDLTGIITIR